MVVQRRRISLAGIALLLAFSRAIPAWALTDEDTLRQFHFNFTSPGARSLGMGGAFAAVADDATAVQANPAGLMYVTTPEFFLEYRSIDQDTTIERSHLGSLP